MTTTQALTPPRRQGMIIHPALEPLRDYLAAHARLIGSALPEHVRRGTNPAAIIAYTLIEAAKVYKNERPLLKCSHESILRSVLLACEMGLRPGSQLGEAYLIGYGGECQMQPGYKGLQRLAYEAGAVERLAAYPVWEKEVEADRFDISWEPPSVAHRPLVIGERGKVIGAWAGGWLKGEIVTLEYMNAADLAKIRAQADSKGPSPAWRDWYEEQCRKSPLKRALKRVRMSVDASALARAIKADNLVESGQGQAELIIEGEVKLTPTEQEQADRAADAFQAAQQKHTIAARSEATGAALEDLTGAAGAPSAEEVARAEAADRAEQEKRDQRRGR